MTEPEFALGIDIGKTKLAAGLVGREGNVVDRRTVRTDLSAGGDSAIPQVVELARTMVTGASTGIHAIGIASTGVVDPEKGLLVSSGSIPNWDRIPIAETLSGEFDVPVVVENDVYAAGLGEALHGAGRGSRRCVYMTISTGVGFASIVDGRLQRGAHELVGQIAHLPMLDGGETVNGVTSGAGIASRASEALGRDVSTAEVFLAAQDGDPACSDIIDRAYEATGRLLAWLQCSIDPELFVLGGSVATKTQALVERVTDEATYALTKYRGQIGGEGRPNVRSAELGDDAGLIGGVAAAWR